MSKFTCSPASRESLLSNYTCTSTPEANLLNHTSKNHPVLRIAAKHNTFSSSTHKPVNTTHSSFYNLQEIVQQYQSQPELLKLILTSKVEEDKRRAEEAKLRSKELDMYLHRITPDYINYKDSEANDQKRRLSEVEDQETLETVSSWSIPMDPHQKRRNSAAVAMVAMGTLATQPFSPSSSSSTYSSCSGLDEHSANSPSPTQSATHAYPSPATDHSDLHESRLYSYSTSSDDEVRLTLSGRPRRRREMQSITKIVETREFPYADSFFWKNNGNTTQKKSGCKSIYFKCSNSNKGCPVNKTVTARLKGDYLIKYRGKHLVKCGKVERIRDL